MATVDRPQYDKNGKIKSYRIRVSQGLDYNGKRITPITATFNVPSGLTEKQILKEAKRFAEDFEKQCNYLGCTNSNMKLGDFCPQYLEIAKSTLSPTTYEFYKTKIDTLIIPS